MHPIFPVNSIVYILLRNDDTVAPARGTVTGHHEGNVLIDVPEASGQGSYALTDVYPTEAAAALVLAEEKLATMTRVCEGQRARLAALDKEIVVARTDVARLRIAAHGARVPTSFFDVIDDTEDEAPPKPARRAKKAPPPPVAPRAKKRRTPLAAVAGHAKPTTRKGKAK